MFHSAALDSYAGDINGALNGLLLEMESAAGAGAPVEVHRVLGAATMQAIGRTAFG